MNAEIVGIGTELLLGQIANTNAQYISDALARIGVDVYFHVVVGDNHGRICDTLRTALGRSDVVIVTGGLGPTPDDITREAVAEVTGRPLVRDLRLVSLVESIFQKLGRDMPEANLRQADLPEGAAPIEPEGTAPGFRVEHDRSLLFALPGVPWEMKAMLTKTVLPELTERAGSGTIATREVIVVGLGESRTHELIADLVDSQTNPTIAYRAASGAVRVRLTAKAADDSTAVGLMRPVEDDIRARLGVHALPPDAASLGEAIGVMLRERGATVAGAESLTGGWLGAELMATSGAGDYFLGSVVCYSNEAKRDLAGVPEAILAGPGAVSEEAAAALAQGAAQRFGADLGLAATGVAGPSEQEGKPVGTLFVAATFGGRTEVRHVQAYGDRDHIRAFAVTSALDLGRRLLQEQ
ncbi:MAG: competence/damage-inducible protein A [Actinomycetota bacterium]|nr:competence/damage-inducible protein A [Actinomycetota bacterium]